MTRDQAEAAIDTRPLVGRIMAPGDRYRGKYAAWEAPPDAVQDGCPLGACEWLQAWDTMDELRQAQIGHVRDDHGEQDPEAAIARARLSFEMERRAGSYWHW